MWYHWCKFSWSPWIQHGHRRIQVFLWLQVGVCVVNIPISTRQLEVKIYILPQARALKQYCHTRSQFPRTQDYLSIFLLWGRKGLLVNNFETIKHLVHIFTICRRDAPGTMFRTVRSGHAMQVWYRCNIEHNVTMDGGFQFSCLISYFGSRAMLLQ